MLKYFGITVVIFCCWASCSTDLPVPKFKTKNVVIVIMDGPRWSETWGDSTRQYIPNLANNMAPEGIIFNHFYNLGPTLTSPGHTEIVTGFKELINNYGNEYPTYPSIFQYYLKATGKDSTKAWVIASKDKLAVLSNCKNPEWNGKYRPATDCGVDGLGTGYREDSVTFNHAMSILRFYNPNLVIINFKQPDDAGHANDWPGYLAGMKATDSYAYQIWSFLQTDPFYKNNTTFIYTNDHGRHCDGWLDGFVSHGDTCGCCKHINLFLSGPDFKKNKTVDDAYEQTDIPFTVAELLGFKMEFGEGNVILDAFKKKIK